jgi:hypothetical protein
MCFVLVAVDHLDGPLVQGPHRLVVASIQGIGKAPVEQPQLSIHPRVPLAAS